MSGNEDLAAPEQGLALIADGITKTLAELKELGMVGTASTGRGFSHLAMSGLELGHGGLTAEFATFCERWEWGVRALVGKGNSLAQDVGLSAGSFHEQEQYIGNSFKVLANSVNGNPYASEEEITKKGWGDVLTQSAYDNRDVSAESMLKAHENVKQTWQDTAWDVNDGLMGSMENAGAVDPRAREAADDKLDDWLDPSDDARTRANDQSWGS
ncbi:hypothetical protein NLX86_16285 [Streptomyces sp. A3M-1-3]|uniref:hypothetical protein n=1 Tax=Streptomyces sp. A3M-1-3 TaxID=2962044 RepID=UPI0020B75615|nr:hypothetical protein [Streptomyces sp. A3M-1-3]MCP3819602.1 hypothetical protein [Streptomyces sp. A3M-1-3]